MIILYYPLFASKSWGWKRSSFPTKFNKSLGCDWSMNNSIISSFVAVAAAARLPACPESWIQCWIIIRRCLGFCKSEDNANWIKRFFPAEWAWDVLRFLVLMLCNVDVFIEHFPKTNPRTDRLMWFDVQETGNPSLHSSKVLGHLHDRCPGSANSETARIIRFVLT